jgi:hypothetical protein
MDKELVDNNKALEKPLEKPLEKEKPCRTTTLTQQNRDLADSYSFGTFNLLEHINDRRNFAITITAKRNTGKTVLLKDMCSKMKGWFSKVYVFSMTAEMQVDAFDFMDKDCIINTWDEEMLNHIWESQKQEVLKLKRLKVSEKDIPKILIIFDDMISDPRCKNSEALKRLFVAGRHNHCALIFLTQHFKAIPPVMRKNVDLAIAFYLEDYDDRYEFTKSYLSTKNRQLGVMIFDDITKQKYQALIILNYKIGQNPEDYVKVYTAKEKLPKFKMVKGSVTKIKPHVNLYPSSGLRHTDFLPKINKALIVKPNF